MFCRKGKAVLTWKGLVKLFLGNRLMSQSICEGLCLEAAGVCVMTVKVVVLSESRQMFIGCMSTVPLKASGRYSDSQRVRLELSSSIACLALGWGHPFQTIQSMPSDVPPM